MSAAEATLARRSPTTAMSHIALHEAKDGQVATWLEKVSDAQDLSGPGSSN